MIYMLTMLTLMEEKKYSFPVSLIKKLLPPRTEGYMRRVGYSPYIRIECELKNGSPDWKMINANTLDSAGRLLMPVGMDCPAETGLVRYRPTRFLRQLFSNLACETLLCMNNSPADREIVLYGREAELALLLPRLAPLAGTIKIITTRAEVISRQISEIEEQTGITIITSEKHDASGADILLAPSGGASVICSDKTKLVISPDRPSSSSPCWIKSVSIAVPKALEELYTPQYDILEMAGAFCEIGGMETLSRLSPDAVAENGEILSPSELAQLCLSLR